MSNYWLAEENRTRGFERMQHKRLQGEGILTCGDVQTIVTYTIIVIIDDHGNQQITGRLDSFDVAIVVIAAKLPSCCLQLEDERELDISITRSEEHDDVTFKGSGPITGPR